ncbi:olfactory receptor 1052-like [Erpetoichthys calabaricus]|uniref:olfactory receptor 1052-like n=1 Tax=Erpetoichthys calabaricus TaxID=27687 RepID=UPI002233FEDC|nr:olfactory receptor 1052-like [Erpetoichthys calabaricus]
MSNTSVLVSEFVLHCAIEKDKMTFTIVALAFIYLVTLFGNLMVIIVVIVNPHLHNPMFFYIGTLAVIDMVNSTNVIPRMLAVLLFNATSVPYGPCLLQFSMVYYLSLAEGFLLSVMACDRYLAVVYPLRYPSIATNKMVWLSILLMNIYAIAILTPYLVFATELSFCHTNVLPYCFCDFVTMIHISCTEDPRHLTLLSSTTIVTGFGGLAVCILSYSRIIVAALRISSADGKRKAFSTMFTHLLVVFLFYMPLIISYMLPGFGVQLSAEAYNVLVIIAIMVPPMMNPIIYSFRNKEIKSSICRLCTGKRTTPVSQ